MRASHIATATGIKLVGRPAKSLQLSWYNNQTTVANYAEAISAYAANPGEEEYKGYHFQVIADTFFDTHFPDVKADLSWLVFKIVRKYELDAFTDKKWCKDFFTWLYFELTIPQGKLEELC